MPFRRHALMAALLSVTFVAQPLGSVASALGVGHAKSRAVIAYDGVVPPIPVKEPLRTKPSFGPRDMMRPKVVPAIRPLNGRRVPGPPLLRPDQIDVAIREVRQRGTAPVRQQPLPVSPAGSVPRPQLRGPARGSVGTQSSGTRSVQSLPNNPTGSGTGINPWWRYQEENVPGGGHVMVNVGTGNLVLQDDDMNVSHKGIALAFRRTYNSQSLHDVYGDDGAPGMYGNGWTSTFDAHLSGTSSSINVWDIDGAMYTYTFQSNGTWQAPVGQHATLASDGACGFLWTKKTGTTYYFWAPYQPSTCTASFTTLGGYAGRLFEIIGRNRNVALSLAYSWDNGITTPAGKISEIVASTESGLAASLAFADVNGHRLLQTLTFPDAATTVTYGYDTGGDLITISHPPNNAAGIRPTQLLNYQRVGANLLINFAASPKTDAACGTSGGCYSDGGGLLFTFAGTTAPTSTVTSIQQAALVNPTFVDGTNAGPIQGSTYATSVYTYNTEYFTTGVLAPAFRDTDGHMTNWMVDTSGRPTQTQECTASTNQGQQCTSWLTTNEQWDTNNNRTADIDARGYEIDYAYDASGNAIAVGEPQTATSAGTFRPTKLFDYDSFNNVTAYCDETETHAAGADWISAPATSDSLCSSHSVPHAKFTFTYPSYEPYGELVTMATPLGYKRQIAYASSQQSGTDYGLPTSVTGDSISQLDSTVITPTQTFWYDPTGNLRCYSKGKGSWVLSYDSLSRLLSVADPDDSSANSGSLCSKSTGQAGWNAQTTYTYFADGAKQTAQSPSERAYGVSSSYVYDLDGNVTAKNTHHGCVVGQSCPTGTTQKYYDGADRLLEVQQPHDTRTLPGTSNGQGASWPVEPYDADAWLTRYLYDLSGGGSVSLRSSSPFHAYGNLYKTQSWLAGDLTTSSGWTDLRGSAFDALDREITKFAYQVAGSGNGAITTTQLKYDTGSNPAPGLLTSKTNPNSEVVAYTYDEHSHIRSQTYSGEGGATPNETYTYDPNGRTASIASSVFGAEQETYDTDGRLSQVQEPSADGVNSPAQLTYSYYGNGEESALSIASSSLTQTNALAYSYRTDGALQTQAVNAVGAAGTWAKTYTDGGRPTAVSGVDAQSHTYDTTGQVSAYSSASGSVALTHDPEGSPLSEAFPSVRFIGMSPIAATESHIYNVRGELLQTTMIDSAGATHSATRSVTNSGFITGDNSINGGGDSSPADVLNGVALGTSSMSSTTYNDQVYSTGSSNAFAFDTSGRLSSQVNLVDSFTQVQNPSDGSTHTSATSLRTTTTFGYDAENRTHSWAGTLVRTATNPDTGATTKTTTNFPTATIGWGPNGHPILAPNVYTSSQGNVTFHWDGDLILFITDTGGNVIDFKIGLDGDITPQDANIKGITAYDRDSAGVIVQSQNATGLSGYGPSDPSTLANPAGTSPGFQQAVTPAGYGHPDGFYIGLLQVSGVRAFHPDLNSWTTPDAYEGDVHDPASQQWYMWNRGNPIDYSDPSGYAPVQLLDGLRRLGGDVLRAIGDALTSPVPSSWPLSAGCTCSGPSDQPNLSGGKSDLQSSFAAKSSNTGPSSVNQMQQQVLRGKAPGRVAHVDKGKVTGEQDQVHFNGEGENTALNRDGTWKHGGDRIKLTNEEKRWLTQNGWTLPK